MGIVSFGIGCGRVGVPGVYTMVNTASPSLKRFFLVLMVDFSGVCFQTVVGANYHQESEEKEPAVAENEEQPCDWLKPYMAKTLHS